MTAPTQPEPEPPPESRVEPESPQVGTRTAPEPVSEPEVHHVATPAEADAAVEPAAVAAQAISPPERETVFVPMSVTIGDGFKFGCGFFLALVLAMLVGFVLLAALFVLTSLFGLNLPITR
jgi:hypothetical protein